VSGLIIAFVMISLIFMVYGDRKIWAAVQMRRGPNVVGPGACCRPWPTR
jgi:NADH-quinone oxidoreductase subunit H